MEFLKNNARGIVISVLVAGAIIGIATLSGNDSDTATDTEATQSESAEQETTNEQTANEESTEQNEKASEEESTEQPVVKTTENGFLSETITGDNQTVVMRRIVENYLSDSNVQLSAEQLLYVETNLVNDYGRSDFVPVGEEISIALSQVAQRVEEAQNLSDAAIARWSAYL